ncbi:MAG: hypothetical protein ACOCVG_04240 [Verrucomicrobiota bacterium]
MINCPNIKTLLAAFILPVAAGMPLVAAPLDQISHLEGLNGLHFNVLTTSFQDTDLELRRDLSDIVELELRRAKVPVFEFFSNEPAGNVPLVEVVLDVQRGARNSFTLRLELRDTVVIERNNIRITATTYATERSGTTPNADALGSEIKNTMRTMMAEFTDAYREVNPL